MVGNINGDQHIGSIKAEIVEQLNLNEKQLKCWVPVG